MSVKIIAHRGANKVAPQNTLPAFERAFEMRADGIETDVHLTADGVPFICHNYEIDKTSNGAGEIRKMNLDVLRNFDFGSYFSYDFEGTKAPTLDELLSLCEKNDFEILNIELKPSLEHDVSVVKKTLDAVKEHGLFEKLLISSFSSEMLVEAKKVDRSCRTAYLYSADKKEALRMMFRAADFAKELGCCALHPQTYYVNKKYVEEAHRKGVQVNVWTVDKEKDIIRLAEMGVDGLITDVPDFAREVLEKNGLL